jgi:hypothetical protein
MSDKKIDGGVADALLDAVEHLTHLEHDMRHLRWRICYHDDPANTFVFSAAQARAHCRKLMQALTSLEHRLQDEKNEADEQGRAIRAVK